MLIKHVYMHAQHTQRCLIPYARMPPSSGSEQKAASHDQQLIDLWPAITHLCSMHDTFMNHDSTVYLSDCGRLTVVYVDKA